LRYRVEDDPRLKALIREQDLASRNYKRALIELRRHYTSNSVDVAKAASLQQLAHDAEHKFTDATHALTNFAWEIVPFSTNIEHLAKIKELREDAQKRVSIEDETAPTGQVVIITTINGVRQRIVEQKHFF
jgi:hypothetical protein